MEDFGVILGKIKRLFAKALEKIMGRGYYNNMK